MTSDDPREFDYFIPLNIATCRKNDIQNKINFVKLELAVA